MTTRGRAIENTEADIVRSSLRGRAWTMALLALAALLIATFQQFILPSFERALHSPSPDARIQAKLAFATAAAVGLLPALCLIATGWQIHRRGQFPLPGAWVWRDTPVTRGWKAARMGWVFLLAGVIGALLCGSLTAYAWIMFDRLQPELKPRSGVTILHDSTATKP